MSTTVEAPARQPAPILKWAGGKRQLLPELRKHFPAKFGVYYEPFVGGGAVFFDLATSGRLHGRGVSLADSNVELIKTYRAIRQDVDAVIWMLRSHARQHSEKHFYETRAAKVVTSTQIAARMIYLNRTCFNGLYRVNKSGGFNVPFGRYKDPNICDPEALRACSKVLQGVQLDTVDFETAVGDAIKRDFIYFDPPYVPLGGEADFTQYTADGFAWKDHERLAFCARGLRKRGVHVLLSNVDLPVVRKLYSGFEMRTVEARRNINSKAGKRGPVNELLIW